MKSNRRPFCDRTKTPPLSPREKSILKRLEAGEQLHIGREYAKDERRIVNSFFWDYDDVESDSAVWMLMRRGLIAPTGVGGGAQWFVIVDDQKKTPGGVK